MYVPNWFIHKIYRSLCQVDTILLQSSLPGTTGGLLKVSLLPEHNQMVAQIPKAPSSFLPHRPTLLEVCISDMRLQLQSRILSSDGSSFTT